MRSVIVILLFLTIANFQVMLPGSMNNASASDSQFVVAKDGHFWVGGVRIYLHGVNYWPRYSLSLYDPRKPSTFYCYTYWITCDYRPADIEQDFEMIRQLGMNLIVIRGIDEMDTRGLANLRDVLHRAQQNSLFVILHQTFQDVGLFTGPLDAAVQAYRDRIQTLNLSNVTNLIGYDIAWELNLGPRPNRQKLSGLWGKWIIDTYGSLGTAESAWGWNVTYFVSSNQVLVTDPDDEQLTTTGQWSKYVTDYWKFAYDWANSFFQPIVGAIKQADPNHLVTIRNGSGGPGSIGGNKMVPPDPSVGANFLDFFSTEGYALPGSLGGSYEWQVGGKSCGTVTSSGCNQQQRIWDNPTDHDYDFIVIPSQLSSLVDPSLWSVPWFNPPSSSASGRVIRGDNGQPLVGVKIDTCLNLNVVTDSNGYFQFHVDDGQGFCVRIEVPDQYAVWAKNPSPNIVSDNAKTALAGLGFTTSYLRCAGNNTKPVVFIEFGQSTGAYPIPQTLKAQRDFYYYFYRAALEYDVDGVVAWWYPGGPRLDERSDFGIVNANNSQRPVDSAIEWYASNVGHSKPKAIDSTVQIPAGTDSPLGYAGVYTNYLPRFEQLLAEGIHPGVSFQLRHPLVLMMATLTTQATYTTVTTVTSTSSSVQSKMQNVSSTTSSQAMSIWYQSYLMTILAVTVVFLVWAGLRSMRRKKRS